MYATGTRACWSEVRTLYVVSCFVPKPRSHQRIDQQLTSGFERDYDHRVEHRHKHILRHVMQQVGAIYNACTIVSARHGYVWPLLPPRCRIEKSHHRTLHPHIPAHPFSPFPSYKSAGMLCRRCRSLRWRRSIGLKPQVTYPVLLQYRLISCVVLADGADQAQRECGHVTRGAGGGKTQGITSKLSHIDYIGNRTPTCRADPRDHTYIRIHSWVSVSPEIQGEKMNKVSTPQVEGGPC